MLNNIISKGIGEEAEMILIIETISVLVENLTSVTQHFLLILKRSIMEEYNILLLKAPGQIIKPKP